MKKLFILFVLSCQLYNLYGQLQQCYIATPFCTQDSVTYAAAQNTTAPTGPNYGCLYSQPNPAWFYCKIASSGNINFSMSNSANVDIDFAFWGPFTSLHSACDSISSGALPIDCSYSSMANEQGTIPSAQTGEYYVVMITNYSNQITNITFAVTGGTGGIFCDELCVTHPYSNSPVCIGSTVQLLSTNHLGVGSYTWWGPNGFSSSQRDTLLSSVSINQDGYYYVNYIKDSTCNYTDSVWVHIDTCGALSGNIYTDINNNCIYDSSELYNANIQVRLSQNGNFLAWAWTDPYGFYYFDVPVGTYTIEALPPLGYTVTCFGSQPHTTTVTTAITTENFALACGNIDIAATGIALGTGFFPGLTVPVYPHIGTHTPNCNQPPIAGRVEIILDSLIHYNGPYGLFSPPDSVNGDTLIWNVSNIYGIGNFGFNDYTFSVNTDTTATTGDTVCITVNVYPVSDDADTTNNTYTRCFAVNNSYDPNQKSVKPSGVGIQGFIADTTPKLQYTVEFQNTGSAPAHNIYILDTLDNDLDIESLHIISSSHTQSTSLLAGNVLKFYFSNIMLPDSVHDEIGSHGYVTYSIGLKPNLPPGREIKNTAYIYFDYNVPVITNTALNTIEYPSYSGIKENKNSHLCIFPNPANNSITITFDATQNGNAVIKLFNINGQLMYLSEVNTTMAKYSKSIDVSSYAKGVYFVQVITEKEVMQSKVVKQ